MASKADRFYFENFAAAAEAASHAANYLVECLKNYQAENLSEMLDKMHSYEHAGDMKKHEMSAALAKAFVTPVDREDLAMISQNIDEVTDCIEEVLQQFYMDHIVEVTPEAIMFAEKLVECCDLMTEMLSEFVNFKKPAKLHELIIKLNDCEEECDALYLEAAHKVREQTSEIFEVLAWRAIYNKMEKCADACEHVGDCVDTVVMKNT